MPLIQPFAGLRPFPQFAPEVIAPPYDVLSSAEARLRSQGKPWSFLHISKAEIDLADNVDPYDASVYQKASENLQRMIGEGILFRDPKPRYYIYRLGMTGHIQTGLVAVASVQHYDSNRIRKHEFTRPAKENDRVRQIEALKAQTGPVLLAYKAAPKIDQLLDETTSDDPVYQLAADDGVDHSLWVVDDPGTITNFTHGFDAMECLYIADGHHRSAAASRVAASMNQADGHMSRYFLSVIFPHNQMKILDYNRVVTDLNGLNKEQILARIGQHFDLKQDNDPVSPEKSGEFGMYLDHSWYRLNIKPENIPQDPVARLDVSLLADHLLEPLLAISDPRTDKRIDFIGGIRGLGELEKRVNSGEMAMAFSMFPTRMEELMAVADANQVMPPKSTWFEPKLADGLVSHLLD